MATKNKIKVLSLFDGIGCARVALQKAGIQVEKYLASEIERVPSSIVARNWPDAVHVGDVTKLTGKNVTKIAGGDIDLIIGGSPCQDLSIAKTGREGLKGSRSGLFYEYARLVKQLKPKYFILENVASMPKEARDEITKVMGVEPIMIDAALVSAQIRRRLFWTNIPGVQQPTDRGIIVKDILEKNVPEKYFVTDQALDRIVLKVEGKKRLKGVKTEYYAPGGTLHIKEATKRGYAIAVEGDAIDISFPTSKTRRGRVGKKVKTLMTTGNITVFTEGRVRKLTPVECERLQGIPDHYTAQGYDEKIEIVADGKRFGAAGNAFNADVIAHILGHIKQ